MYDLRRWGGKRIFDSAPSGWEDPSTFLLRDRTGYDAGIFNGSGYGKAVPYELVGLQQQPV